MIVVIQCAATKQANAGCLVAANDKPVIFVANPEMAPADGIHIFARPDGRSDYGKPWREVLLEYNLTAADNPLGLCQAYRLYDNAVYGRLVERFGMEKLYVLSAGWGLINAAFLTPYYDITFSASTEGYKRRRKYHHYDDFRMLPNDITEEIVFLGGKDYVPLFCSLTSVVKACRTVFFNSKQAPDAPGCTAKFFPTSRRTNWHYECANALVEGRI